jgi:glycosyltransferase involved in cell wall biosynthesis
MIPPPTLAELPPSPPGKSGWPWSEGSQQLPESMPDGSPWPSISIVTPSYNQGQFIEETIRSVLLQGYPNLEYIVIDGNSSDESIQIIKKYASWLKYWTSEPDRGQSSAINKGLKHCSGDIFNWINSDDLLTPGALHTVAIAWHNTPHVIIAGCVINFHEEGSENLISPNALSLENFVNIRKARKCIMRWHQPGTFLPGTEVRRIGGLQENLRFGMDHFLMIGLFQRCNVVYVPDILARFRLHNSSKTSRYGYLQFRLERVKKLRGMKYLQKYVTVEELKQEQVSVLLALADLERRKARHISSCRLYAKALATSPFLTIVALVRQSLFGHIIRGVKRGAKNIRKTFLSS